MPEQRASAVLNQYWNGCLPVDVYAIATAMEVRIEPAQMDGPDISGVVSLENGRTVIKFNASDALVRQRFTIAHELGHFALGHLRQDGQVMFRDSNANYSMSSSWLEREANRFAASLLMPADALRFVIQTGRARTLIDLAELFGVSQAAMQFRVNNLGIFNRV